MNAAPPGAVHVAAGALVDAAGRVLLARRPPGGHLGGLWEFPGGKLEPGESPRAGLARELGEELGIEPLAARPLIQVSHRYPEKHVLLDVWRVTRWRGEPVGREGQPLRWVSVEELARLAAHELPAADRPIVQALGLPALCVITPEPAHWGPRLLPGLQAVLEAGVRLVLWRTKRAPEPGTDALLAAARALCGHHGARLVLNAPAAAAGTDRLQGVHLDSSRLREARARPLPADGLLGASCHDARELARAAALGADYALLSPVLPTTSHPGAPALGWEAFAALVRPASLPVYALGGMRPEDLPRAWAAGAQGVAVLGGIWNAASPGEATAGYMAAARCAP